MIQAATDRERKFWGWGYSGEGLSDAEIETVGQTMHARFGVQPHELVPAPFTGRADHARAEARAATRSATSLLARP